MKNSYYIALAGLLFTVAPPIYAESKRIICSEPQKKLDEMLFDACLIGCVEDVEKALKYGANVNSQNDFLKTPLMVACLYREAKIVEILLKNGAGASINYKDKEGLTALIIICAFNEEVGNLDFGIALLGYGVSSKEGIDYVYEEIKTLHVESGFAARISSYLDKEVEIVEMLLEYGADVNHQTEAGITALMYASSCCGEAEIVEIVKMLLKYGAEVNVQTSDGFTLLMGACSSECFCAKRACFENGGRVKIVRMLLESGVEVNMHSYGITALALACWYFGNVEAIELLLQNGAEVNAQDEDGRTALMIAKSVGHSDLVSEIVELLLQYGAIKN